MKPKLKKEFELLKSPKERAVWLLKQGVKGKLCVNTETLAPTYRAFSADVCITPAGDHETEQEAIAAGTKWLANKAEIVTP